MLRYNFRAGFELNDENSNSERWFRYLRTTSYDLIQTILVKSLIMKFPLQFEMTDENCYLWTDDTKLGN